MSTPNGPPSPKTPAQELLTLLSDPFTQQLQENTLYSAFGISIMVTLAISLLFSMLRPYNQAVYAPKLKHADKSHAPPAIGSALWSWISPLLTMKEDKLIHYIGMDATVFLRFMRMCRNIFLLLTILYCTVLVPINYVWSTDANKVTWVDRITPLRVWGNHTWALVTLAWASNLSICGILFFNYRKVVALRRLYFESEEYRRSLHSRTLMVSDIPRNRCSDEGIAAILDMVAPDSSFARTTIARNVKHLPGLITEYETSVRRLESILAKYLKNPDRLPAARPMCLPAKEDRRDYPSSQKVDAIEYWNTRVARLRLQILEARRSVDRRNTYPYGFASFPEIFEAHAVALRARNRHPAGATIRLATRPTDVIWENMHLDASARRLRRMTMTLWIALLTVLWIGPNAMVAIFLVNLNNLAKVWPGFATQLSRRPRFWAVFQGVAAPAITSGFYLILPVIFRRLQVRAGDQTKTGRERHVMSKLYSFFVFNNLVVFSLFSTIWGFVASVVADAEKGIDLWKILSKQELAQSLFISLCKISLFWVTWLLQRQLGAAIDLAQLWTLLYSFVVRRLTNPTPRQLIELTAPPNFDYAVYYNYFLFYSTVALVFAGLQPLVLPAAALYFTLDVALKKYLLLYVFVTKNESGGLFWRPLFNRLVFAVTLSNLVVLLAVWARGDWGIRLQVFATAPLPLLMLVFKFTCKRMFDDRLYYYSKNMNVAARPESLHGVSRNDKLAARYGQPVLYKALFKPMVHKKAQHCLAAVLNSTTSGTEDDFSGYSDSVVKLANMQPATGVKDGVTATATATSVLSPTPPGSVSAAGISNFELVAESNLDFEHFKNRAEFAEGHGGGDIFARPGTPSTLASVADVGYAFDSRPGTPVARTYSAGSDGSGWGPAGPRHYPQQQHFSVVDSSNRGGLIRNAAPMGTTAPTSIPLSHHEQYNSNNSVPPHELIYPKPPYSGRGRAARGYGPVPQYPEDHSEYYYDPGPVNDGGGGGGGNYGFSGSAIPQSSSSSSPPPPPPPRR